MALEIRSNQIRLADAFTFSGATVVPTPTDATHAATKAYVDSKIVDPFSGGDGIVIDASGNPDVISVDLATTNPALEFVSNKLALKLKANTGIVKDADGAQVQLKSESGGTISVDASGLFIADSAIGNAKLANSTISGKALGGTLDALAAGQGLAIGSAYNGSAGQTMDLNLDGSTLAKSSSGVKVADGGVGATQLADDSVGVAKIAFSFEYDVFAGDGSATAFALNNTAYDAAGIMVTLNGQMLKRVASSPAAGEFLPTTSNVTIGGAARDTNDEIMAIYLN